MINLHKLDPDWDFAQQHGKASVAGVKPTVDPNTSQKIHICRCCHQYINKQKIGLWEHSKQLEFLGRGFPLFYQFLKNCIILLILAICSYNALSLQQAIIDNKQLCHGATPTHRMLGQTTTVTNQTTAQTTAEVKDPTHGQCYTFMIQIARVENSVSVIQQGLRIISFVLHALALMYIRNRITKLEAQYDERTTTLSDFSLFFKRLPLVNGIQTRLKQFLQRQFSQPHQIKQITLLPFYETVQILEKQRNSIINQLRKFYGKQRITDTQFLQKGKLQQNLRRVEINISMQLQKFRAMAENDQVQCQKIICVFNTEKQKQDILDQFNNISVERKIQYFGESASKIYVKQAPDPEMIMWQNANLSKKTRNLRTLLGWVLSLLTIAATFVIFYFIIERKSIILQEATLQLQKHPEDSKAITQYRGAVTLVFVMMFLVVIFDKVVLAILFHKFTDLQKHTTTSKFQFSFALKFALGLFFTTALMTLAVEAIRFRNYYTHGYGVIDQETIMFFMNSFFVPFFWLVNPFRIAKLVKRKIHHQSKKLTQKQANALMQQENYDMGKRFAQVLEMMWFTFLYSTLIPIGAVITCCGLLFYYWVDKYNLLRRSRIPGNISAKLVLTCMTLLDFTLILRPIGSIIFDNQIRSFYMNSNIIMIVIGFVYIITPKGLIIEYLNNQKFKPQQNTYQEIKQIFHKTYHSQHPIYRMIYSQLLQKQYLKKGLSFTSQNSEGVPQIYNQVVRLIKTLVSLRLSDVI